MWQLSVERRGNRPAIITEHRGVSEILDYQLLFKGSKTGSYATIEPKEGSKVPVLVWEISERDEQSLDHYEGYPDFYQKQDFAVELDGHTVTAMAYVMDTGRPLGNPSSSYYYVLYRAYKAFGFDMNILKTALDESANLIQNPC